MNRKVLQKEWAFVLFAALLSAAALLFASECSPLYPINQWYDANCFFTVGKGMLEGKIPYRDLYEQKGPYVYFLHALCALVDGESFLGVWLAEILSCFLFLLSVRKILALYNVGGGAAFSALALIGLSVCFSFAFSTGDSVEEFALPLFSWMVYLALKRVRTDGKFRLYDFFLAGAGGGMVFWSKFTLVGFFVAWYLFFLYHAVRNRQWKILLPSVGLVLCGALAATLPPFLYFAANGAVGDWLHVYLYDNLFVYDEGGNVFLRLGRMIVYILGTLGANIHYNFFVLLGIVGFARIKDKARAEERVFLLVVPAVTVFFLYVGGRGYRYYGLPLAVFAVFGYIFLAEKGFRIRKRRFRALVPAVALAFCCLFMGINGNYAYIFKPEEETVQYRFAEVIKEKEDATLLNYGFLDGGFYLAADKVPDFRYFCTLNIPLPEMREETERYIEEGKADFIVLKMYRKQTEELKSENYREVMRVSERYSLLKTTYILYERV